MTQPWWRKKWFVIPAGIIGALIIIGAIVGKPPTKHTAKGISAPSSPSASASSTSSSAAPTTSEPAPPPAKPTSLTPVSVPPPSHSVPSLSAPAAPTSYTSAQAVAAACTADGRFVAKLYELTPRGDLITLEKYAGNILTPLLHVKGDFSTAASNLYADANTLLAYVGSGSFTTQGTPIDPQITNVAADCP